VNETNRTREDQWFLENEKHLVEAARVAREKREAERRAREKDEERKKLKDLHFMKCPKCGHDMKERVVETVTVEQCTFCEGIYFDAGELEQAILRKAEQNRSMLRKLLGI
jgi:ribosomal protein L32